MPFHLEVVTPERTAVSEEAVFVLARTLSGDIGVLAGHAPLLAGLDVGRLEIHTVDDRVIEAVVDGGFMQVSPESVSVLADVVELKEEIDVETARQMREEALEALAREETDANRAMLRSAEVRIEIKSAD